jgi:hypothetical protein
VSGETWTRYKAWSEAIAEEVFSPAAGGRPAYLDLEEDVLSAVWQRVGPSSIVSPIDDLGETVRGTLDLERGGDVFRHHRIRVNLWETTGRKGPPPTLGLLAVLSLAAEAMAAGDGMASTNYYGRLAQRLRLGDDSTAKRVESAYREIAQRLWDSVNDWLEREQGEHGLPTAYGVGVHRHIGLPLSQALIRATDRRNLHRLFAAVGLSPGEAIGLDDMFHILDDWIGAAGSSVGGTLRRLWERGDEGLCERIARVAAVELEAWAGDVIGGAPDPQPRGRENARLSAVLSTFLARRLDLGLEFRIAAGPSPDEVSILGAGSEHGLLSGSVIPLVDQWLRVGAAAAVDPASLLGVPVTIADVHGQPLAVHRPSGLYVFVRDDATGVFLQRERVVLGADLMLIVVDRLVHDVMSVIPSVARPGYHVSTFGDLAGVPRGWTVLSGVQVMAVPQESDRAIFGRELNALLPIAATQLVVGNGLALPGRIPRWSSIAPPEIRAASASAGPLTVTVTCLRTMDGGAVPPEIVVTAPTAAVVVSLEGRNLPDGDYEVVATRSTDTRPLGRRGIRLRSADVPSPNVDREGLGHVTSDSLWPIRSVTARDLEPVVRGGFVDGGAILETLANRRRTPRWRSSGHADPERTATTPIRLAWSREASCATTGAHRLDVQEVRGGGRRAGEVDGTCRNCGLIKRYPATWGRLTALRRAEQGHGGVERQIASLQPLRSLPLRPISDGALASAADAALDSLMYLAAGRASQMALIASQLEASSLFEARFVRALEALGHLEFSRDECLRVVGWEATHPTLVELPDSRGFLLVGCAGRTTIAKIADAVGRAQGELRLDVDGLGLPRRVAVGVDRASVASVVAEVGLLPNGDLHVSLDTARRLASLLPPLSSVIGELPVRRIPPHQSRAIFDIATASWRAVDRVDGPGGYRFEGYGVSYGVRVSSHPIGEIAIADSSLARFGAAQLAGEPLASYLPDQSALVVPLGADLPGLYGRAAVLASGWLPRRSEAGRALCYRDIPVQVADRIVTLLET